MLPRTQRLVRILFDRVYTHGRTSSAPHVFVRAMRTMDSKNRFAVVVSKKVAGCATERNLLRRRVYHILRGFDTSQKCRGMYGILVMKKDSPNLSFSDLEREVRNVVMEVCERP